ncbi:hypothetical protein G4G27_22040 [Sphingomonas sp. So64.6b]|uniref:HD domain-containing protein n=1 Tax=Sphingomonas sp. So64.6b TaxID=2997354 RepID=UPI001601B8A4|nr:HD domain-containing protein [Sphingomonas sp. So64.6b]QNA86359.1 hypothetical protein G4G27_22040 [Sphingomonas sp. So64.6b]
MTSHYTAAFLSTLTALPIDEAPILHTAIDQARSASEPWLFNHVMRTWLFATHIAVARGVRYDAEVLAVGSILHDLGLTDQFAGENRFEVDGANAARNLIGRAAPEMATSRQQLVWDCIALHSTGSIAKHKEVEVALVNAGVALDYGGSGLDSIESETLNTILAAFPRLEMKQRFCGCLSKLAADKPATTYGTWVADFGLRFVADYSPPSSVDTLFAAPFPE